jgi:hypothetical protein
VTETPRLTKRHTGGYKPCGQCGKQIYAARCNWERTKFCSRECMERARGSSTDPVVAFWLKVEKRGPDECWGWKAQKIGIEVTVRKVSGGNRVWRIK